MRNSAHEPYKIQMQQWIDSASYEDLLRRWRMAPIGDNIFDEVKGIPRYYVRVMHEKRARLTPQERIDVSKRVGWDKHE